MKLRIIVAFLLLTLIWGASFLWIKIAVQELTPYLVVAFRLVFGVAGLGVFVLLRRPQLPTSWRSWRDLAILGIIATAAPWFAISWAETRIDSALASVLNSTVPLMTLFLAHFFLHDDRMTRPRMLGLLVGFAGVIALSRSGTSAGGDVTGSLLGQGGMLLAALLYAISGVFARRRMRDMPVLVQAFYSMVIATVIWWLGVPFSGDGFALPERAVTWVALLWLGVLGAGIASYLFYFLLHAIGPTRASVVTYTIPVIGVTLGVVVLNEHLDVYLVAGTLLIVSGVWVVSRR